MNFIQHFILRRQFGAPTTRKTRWGWVCSSLTGIGPIISGQTEGRVVTDWYLSAAEMRTNAKRDRLLPALTVEQAVNLLAKRNAKRVIFGFLIPKRFQ